MKKIGITLVALAIMGVSFLKGAACTTPTCPSCPSGHCCACCMSAGVCNFVDCGSNGNGSSYCCVTSTSNCSAPSASWSPCGG
jgi:hypothetical protein